jgi:hypothetical protein
VASLVFNLWRRSVLMRLPYHNPMFWTVSMLLVACSVEPGLTSTDANEALKHFASTGANGTITSRTGPERRYTIFLLTALMPFEPLRAVLMMVP